MGAEQQDSVQEFINHHVMHHAGSTDAWNLPFVRLPQLEWFHYDAVMVFVVVGALLCLAWRVRRAYAAVPRGIAAVVEAYVVFVRDQVVAPSFGAFATPRFVSFFCSLFAFIFCANLLGLIPLFSAATGNVSVTAGLATIFMVVALGAVVKLRGARGLKAAFIPHGLPAALVPLMAVMEVISFFSRVFALTIRLFCNLLAGHIVIYSLLGLVLVFGWPAFPAVAMAVLMYVFELFVALLQAYIFTLLSAIFMGMMLNPEH
jgi:F-type H+-transporting ATPase subunit a